MDCPGIDRLIDFHADPGPNPEFEAHLEGCANCRAELRIIHRIPEAYRHQIEVPERLIQRVLAELPRADRSPETHQAVSSQTLITGLLGSLTATAAVLAVQSVGSWTVSGLLLFAVGIGAVSAGIQAFAQRTPPEATT